MTTKKAKPKDPVQTGIKSMTGFGRSACGSPYGTMTVEIKTLNHKSLSITCNPFSGFFALETEINKILGKKISRGKVFVKVSREGAGADKDLHEITVNEGLIGEYLRRIKKMQKKLKIEGEILIRDVMALPGALETSTEGKETAIWPYIRKALEAALDKLITYRTTEGVQLAKDFENRLGKIGKAVDSISKYENQSVMEYRKRLTRSIREISEKVELDKGRLETEVATFARNCDIAEEITRLKGHLTAYEDAMRKVKTDAGKKMDFIAQEMQREINTIGSKSNDFRISKAVIEIKSEIDKIREQIRNIE
ncbi:MAG: YicC/YloC family endoribonuclease [Candidatus Omnitrophota bacterium]